MDEVSRLKAEVYALRGELEQVMQEYTELEQLYRAGLNQQKKLLNTLNEVGGSMGLKRLISDVDTLRSERHRENAKALLGGPSAPRTNAGSFGAPLRGLVLGQSRPTAAHPKEGFSHARVEAPHIQQPNTSADERTPATGAAAVMNPDRARLISTSTLDGIPESDRHLIEPRPSVVNPASFTGSNQMPLGPRRSKRRLNNQRFVTVKREPDDELQSSMAKQPRVDIGRASTVELARFVQSHAHTNNGRAQATFSDPLTSSARVGPQYWFVDKITDASGNDDSKNNHSAAVDHTHQPVVKFEDEEAAFPSNAAETFLSSEHRPMEPTEPSISLIDYY